MYKISQLIPSALVTGFIVLTLTACSTQTSKPFAPPSKPIQLRVHNDSEKIIDSIDAKPCGSTNKEYKTQMTGIKPQQKIMLEIYMHCVDLVALDGFGTVLNELQSLRLNSNITWSIR